jgi:hypothetical protein
MKDQSTEHLQQLAWECGFTLETDLPRLIKFAALVRADAFSAGFESGMGYQKTMSIKLLEKVAKDIGGIHV